MRSMRNSPVKLVVQSWRVGVNDLHRAVQIGDNHCADGGPRREVDRSLDVVLHEAAAFDRELWNAADSAGYQEWRLGIGEDLPGCHVVELLNGPRRPFDSDGINVGGVVEAEVGAQLVIAIIPAVAAGDLPELPAALPAIEGLHADPGANGRAVGDGADQLDRKPGIGVSHIREIIVVKIVAAAIAAGGEQVEKAVVIVVHPGTTEGISNFVHWRASGHLRESAVAVIVIKGVYRADEARAVAGFI